MCLDVAGLAANLYRRNTPLIKVSAGTELTCYMLLPEGSLTACA